MNRIFDERIQRLREEITASHNYDKKFDIWANTAANICHDIATSKDVSIHVDRFFYAFQSPPIESPKFLIIAFNPADRWETTYIKGCKNENRNFDKIRGEELKQPNMDWNKKHNTWRIWQNLKKSFISTDLNRLLDSFVYMNMVYFGSQTVDSFYKKNQGAEIAQKICTELTNILVFEIFKPNYILCLGNESFAGVGNGLEQSQVSTSPINDNVKSKYVNHTLVVGIPHASGARNISDEERVNMGDAIHQTIFKNPVTSINRVNTLNTKFEKSTLSELMGLVRSSETLSNHKIIEVKEKGGNIRYVVEGFDNDELEITITSQGYIGVRHAKVEGRYINESEIDNNRYVKVLESLGFRNDDKEGTWIGIKSFGQYNTKELIDLTQYIEIDITKFIEEYRKSS